MVTMAGLNSVEIYDLFKATNHHEDVFMSLLGREYIVYRIFNETRSKMPDVILQELKINSKIMQLPNRKIQIHIHVILQDGAWRILEYTFYNDENFICNIQKHIKEMPGKIKEVDKIVLYGHARLVKAINIEKPELKNVILRQSGSRADVKMRLPSKQEMASLMNSMRQVSTANVYSHPKYDFLLDSILHYLEFEPRDLCGNYKSMFEDLKLYDALTEMSCEFWLMMQINMAKEGDGGVCELKHVIHVDTNDNIRKVIGQSLDLLCEYTFYNIGKIVIFPYCVLEKEQFLINVYFLRF